MRANIVILEGIDKFPENEGIMKARRESPKEYLSLDEFSEYYHGVKRDECLLVKYRREKTYDKHYLDIYFCLSHQKETCRCGWEWEYYLKGLYEEDTLQTHK